MTFTIFSLTVIIYIYHFAGTVTKLDFFKRTDLFSTSEDGTFCAWRVGTWEPRTFRGHKYVPFADHFS